MGPSQAIWVISTVHIELLVPGILWDVPTGIPYFIFQESCIRIGMSQLAFHTLFFKKAVYALGMSQLAFYTLFFKKVV